MLAETVTWPQVALALVAGAPGIIAAYFAARGSLPARQTKRELQTGNNKTVGEMVTEMHGEASREAITYDQHGGGR